MLESLLGEKVKFILVGAYALAAHGFPRATGDMDIWVKPDESNSKKVYSALANFGAPISEIRENEFSQPGIKAMPLQLGEIYKLPEFVRNGSY
jgi:hypothetical protein